MRILKKRNFFVLSVLFGFSGGYSADVDKRVVSQGGPLGTTSIGSQDIQGSSNDQKAMLLELKKQVRALQGQIEQMQSSQSGKSSSSSGSVSGSSNAGFSTYNSRVDNKSDRKVVKNVGLGSQLTDVTSDDMASNVSDDGRIIDADNTAVAKIFSSGDGIDVGGAPAITTQGQVSYIGSYTGNNTIPIGMISSNLFASTIIGQRGKFDDYSIFFGGYLEADAQAWNGNKISRRGGSGAFKGTGQNIYLTDADLYFVSNLGHYVTAEFEFDTDEQGDFSLGTAMVIFGNLDTSPWFVTAGRSKPSVGTYGGGGPWSNGITDAFLSPDKTTNVSLNYKNDTLNANVSVFGGSDSQVDFSTGLFYADSITDELAGGFNVGYVYNMAQAGNSNLRKVVGDDGRAGVINIEGNLGYTVGPGIWQVTSGWSSTTDESYFGSEDSKSLTGAWYVGTAYALNLYGRDTNFNLSYGQSYNAGNTPMQLSASPLNFGDTQYGIQNQIIVSSQRAYFDNNVLFGPEYSWQRLYGGEAMNTITLDMSVYL